MFTVTFSTKNQTTTLSFSDRDAAWALLVSLLDSTTLIYDVELAVHEDPIARYDLINNAWVKTI